MQLLQSEKEKLFLARKMGKKKPTKKGSLPVGIEPTTYRLTADRSAY
jgi:hypothetical protein